MLLRSWFLLVLVLMTWAGADDIDSGVTDNIIIKALREMKEQAEKENPLNLPANASSIRENITDTFSCENRTYGYYADVDNECQIFHVCVPSQTPSGRNITYKYSFICPNETIFNQEVLTCTRPRDSIPCEESPMYYHLNMEIGKETNKTEETNKKERKTQKRKDIKRKENLVMENMKRKENTVMENFIKDIIKEELKEKLDAVEFDIQNNEANDEITGPMLINSKIENVEESSQEEKEREEELDRIIMERNLRDVGQIRRGGFRFKSDV